MNLMKNIQAWTHLVQSTAGTTDVAPTDSTGIVIDMQDFEGCLFLGTLDTVTAAGTCRMWPMHSDSTSTTDLVACTDYISGTTATTTDHDGQILALDVYKPVKRYLGVYVDRATQAATINIMAIQYGPRKGPVSHSTALNGMLDPTMAISISS